MPTMKVKDIGMYYEIHGEKNGEPLVLIAVLGSDLSGWAMQIPEFSKKYKVIAFDNRDVGRTSKTNISYTIDTMAEDTYNLLDRLGVKKAHILGGSMGGMIAQAFAVNYPEMVRSLILCATTSRWFKGLTILTIWKELNKTIPLELFIEESLVWNLSRKTLEDNDFVKMTIEQLAKYPYIQPTEAFIRQCNAIEKFDATDRLKEIKAPTLVLVGDEDILIPVRCSEELAAKIPKAELKVLPGCGHVLNFENAKEFNETILKFLEKH